MILVRRRRKFILRFRSRGAMRHSRVAMARSGSRIAQGCIFFAQGYVRSNSICTPSISLYTPLERWGENMGVCDMGCIEKKNGV